nr:MAG TPA_asm: Oligoribonuclease [Caudoviricetes sp.]
MGPRPPRTRLPARLPRPHGQRPRHHPRLLPHRRLAATPHGRHTPPLPATRKHAHPHQHQERQRMNTQHDITAGGQTLDPPTPPRKPHRLLWIDLETTGISRTEAKILEIGMIVTSLDAAEEGDRFICPVHPDHVSLYDLDPKVLRMHLDNGLLDTVMQTEPEEFGYANVARNLAEFIRDESSQYELHPAGTNVDYDIDVLTSQLAPYLHPDWLRELTNHRKLDLSTYRISDLALDHDPYQGHTGTHRVEDCIRRDRNDYANYLDIMRAGHQGTQS